jgi:hypothetical protein
MAATQAEQAAQPYFTINIMAQRNSIKEGSELRVKVLLTNSSGHDIIMHTLSKRPDMAELNYRIFVRDEGSKLQERQYRGIGEELAGLRLERRFCIGGEFQRHFRNGHEVELLNPPPRP